MSDPVLPSNDNSPADPRTLAANCYVCGEPDNGPHSMVCSRGPLAGRSNDEPTGAQLITTERQRQIDAEGWTPEHDREHADEALALAACCYALPPTMRRWQQKPLEFRESGRFESVTGQVPMLWPWSANDWKPKPDDRIRELVKAGALIAAEIDRLSGAH